MGYVPMRSASAQISSLSMPTRGRRISRLVALARGAKALVTGDVVGQVASQTLENLQVIGSVATLPVFRPLIGMDKQEIMDEARRLGSYAISVIPDQDCCTLFTPRHPATRSRLPDLVAVEQTLSVDEMVESAVAGAVVEDFTSPAPKLRC